MTIIESLYEFFQDCSLLEDGRKININYLPSENREYSINVTPTSQIITNFIDGSTRRQYLFTFESSEYYDANTLQALTNCGFLEQFSSWLETQTKSGNLPSMESGKQAEKIEAQSTGYLFQVDEAGKAKYQIQCRLIYKQRRA